MTWARDAMEPDFTAGPIYDGEVCGRPRPRSATDGTTVNQVIFTTTTLLNRVAATDRSTVAAARAELQHRIEDHARRHGYVIVSVQSRTDPPPDSVSDVRLRLEALLVERTDGEWPAIRAAIQEDQVDREAARLPFEPVDHEKFVRDRLDRLRESVGVWGRADGGKVSAGGPALPGHTPG